MVTPLQIHFALAVKLTSSATAIPIRFPSRYSRPTRAKVHTTVAFANNAPRAAALNLINREIDGRLEPNVQNSFSR